MKKILLTFLSIFFLALAGPLFAADTDQSTSEALAVSTVNINEADAAELAEVLTGVGEAKAQAIVAYRDQFGAFTSIEQLKEVKGIGEAILSANSSRIKL